MNNKEKVKGIQVYPECADGDGILGVGDVSDILSNTDSYHDNNEYAVRLALADGVLGNWEKLGGYTVHNGETWPGMFYRGIWIRNVSDRLILGILYLFTQ